MTNGDSIDWTHESWWSGTRRPLMSAETLPAAAYADDRFFDDENLRLFASAWVCVGFGEDAREDRLLVRQVAGKSVIITRTADGQVHAFHNSCRHRGTELAEVDCDVKGTIRCPYHRWCYTLDGSLVRTPMFDEAGVEAFDHEDYGLLQVRADTWGCLLFVCLDATTPDLDTCFGDLSDRLSGYGLQRWAIHDTLDVEIAANWKLIVENFSEYYHLPFVHPELIKVSRVEDHYRYQGSGMYLGMTTTPVSGDERNDWSTMPPAIGLGASDLRSGRFIALFPNVLLSVLPNHTFVIVLEPLTADRTRERCAWLLPPGSPAIDAGHFALTRTFWIDVNNEDIDFVQRAQRGLERGSFLPGRLSPRFEEPLHRFHNMVADHLTASPAMPATSVGATSVTVRPVSIPDGDPSDAVDILGSGVNPLPYCP